MTIQAIALKVIAVAAFCGVLLIVAVSGPSLTSADNAREIDSFSTAMFDG